MRLGRVEAAILGALTRAGGLMQRDEALQAAFPRLRPLEAGPQTPAAIRQYHRRRGRAEATVSRAIVSLERKGLVARERNATTGRTLLRSPERHDLPVWEEIARAEEDLAAYCRRQAASWTALARRSRGRAAAVRADRSADATEGERRADIDEISRLQHEQREEA